MTSQVKKTIIITGAAGGIGSAAAAHFAAAGAQLMLVDLSLDALDTLRKNLLQAPVDGCAIDESSVQVCAADVSKADQVEHYVEQTKACFGGVDCFMNNAGVEGPIAAITDFPLEDFEQVMAVNVTGVWLGMKYVVPLMQESIAQNTGGSIIITSSVGGVMGSPGMSAYVTSKHAVIGIMRTAALELAAQNIRVNTIHPGMVDTGMAQRIAENSGLGVDSFAEQICANTPLGRYAQPQDIIGMIDFLFSEASSYCTGQQYFIDGGMGAA